MSTAKPEREGVAAVNRALAVLSAFDSSPQGWTLKGLSDATGLYESTILRLLDSLILAGFVKRLSDSRYVVGPRVLPLSEMYRRSFRLSDYTLPRLRALTEATNECASLYVQEGSQRVCLHHVQPQRSVRSHVTEGAMLPLDRGAAGHVILALAEGVEGEIYDRIRSCGYAITQRERDPESAAIACPVFSQGTRLLGALSLVIPLYRFSDAIADVLIPTLQQHACALTSDLGGVWPAFEPFLEKKSK